MITRKVKGPHKEPEEVEVLWDGVMQTMYKCPKCGRLWRYPDGATVICGHRGPKINDTVQNAVDSFFHL